MKHRDPLQDFDLRHRARVFQKVKRSPLSARIISWVVLDPRDVDNVSCDQSRVYDVYRSVDGAWLDV